MKTVLRCVLGVILFVFGALATAQSGPIAIKPGDMKWTDMKGMPAGWKVAALVGDSEKAGPYVERIKIPANASIPPHSHPDTENITVIAGTFGIGTGDKFDKTKGTVLSAGSFYMLPANTLHYAWSGPQGVTLQIHGVGPSGMTMADSPKK